MSLTKNCPHANPGDGLVNDNGLRGHVRRTKVSLLKDRIECGDVHMHMEQSGPAHYGLLDAFDPFVVYVLGIYGTDHEGRMASSGVGTR